MFEHDLTLENAVRFSRFDEASPFSTVSVHAFELEEMSWLTAEHYYQYHKFANKDYQFKILTAADGKTAYELGNRWFKRKASDWKSQRRLWMTRALYRKTMEHDSIKQALLETSDQLIIETSAYDHFWGIGRDQRGENTLGKIWMDIREKIQSADAPAKQNEE